ncbi:ribosome-binding factor A [Orenia metallireducens]|jgi:ribosome-binding factor A|uniref:Ribosome-binding factor A n=1 Tax=Orenia metallireducens TaxID=1413210 RepID=A0A285FLW5_9FIRM|nr:30S ribosome-binding factor RbfA [Orenia metallireducens]PRX33624.1 ribosome-binding factor A [Orenia metallireducens]SNY12292.1 ribosome-binding factor A [Orenia metallireducens]
MSGHRPERLAELIKKEVSDLLQKDIKDPRIGFVTVTDVEVSGDLRHAKIFISILNGDKEETMAGLEATTGFVRKELGKRIRLRHVPEVIFRYDTTIETGTRVFKILEEINHDKKDGIDELEED